MTREELLQDITDLAAEDGITREQLLAAYEEGLRRAGRADRIPLRLSISTILSYLGGAIVFIGIGILIAQNWDALNTTSKILVTLGSGLLAYTIGIVLERRIGLQHMGQAFFFLSGLLLPLGLGVTLDLAGLDLNQLSLQSAVSFALFLMYLASFLLLHRGTLLIFTLLFGTWAFFAFTSFLTEDNPALRTEMFFEYRALVVGLAWTLLGHFFAGRTAIAPRAFSGFLYTAGAFIVLGAALALGGWTPEQSVFWELIFPGLAFAFIFLSIPVHSRGFLIAGSLALMAYILKITAEYFQESIGWPLSVIVAGLFLIAVGYGTYHVNRMYLGRAA